MTASLGRVRLITGTPPCSPGKCVICGGVGDQESKFIDIGFDIDFYGVVYFCEHCIKEVMNVLGFVPKEYLDRAHDACNEYSLEIEDLNTKIERMTGALAVLRDVGVFDFNLDTDEPNVVDSAKKTESVSGQTVTAKPGPPKSTNESRPARVRNNDSSKKQSTKYDL